MRFALATVVSIFNEFKYRTGNGYDFVDNDTGMHHNLRNLQEGEPAPLKVGDEYETRISLLGDSAIAPELSEGETKARFEFQKYAEASYMAVHFSEFYMEEGCVMKVSGKDMFNKKQEYEMTGSGKMGLGTFWAEHVKGDTIYLQIKCSNGMKAKDHGHFVVDKYAVGYGPGHEAPGNSRRKAALCGTDDKENAKCYETSTEYSKARAVARLLIDGSSLCTGWLASASNHLVTNEHCINSAAKAANTDYEFMAEAPSCGSSNCQLCHAGAVFSGATLIQDNSALDYALVQITSGDPAGTYGFLEIDNRDAIAREQIYIPQHPGGRAKELGFDSSHSQNPGGICEVDSITEPGCGSGVNEVGYYCDTEGGSSGSPVLATSTHKVIALHHCRGSSSCTQTGADPNRGVPIDLVCSEICPLLGSGCTVGEDCDDSDPCTTDTCSGGVCNNEPQFDCCGNGICETDENCSNCAADCSSGDSGVCGNGVCEPLAGEDCLTCPEDCRGRQDSNPSRRYCCGDGAGENPVGCGDSRCTADTWACGVVETSCCGDGACEGAEDSSNCLEDCPVPICGDGFCDPGEDQCSCPADCGTAPSSETGLCLDGVDNDCDGFTDCDDGDCAGASACLCLPKSASCTQGSDCCSGSCKNNGLCR